jgi:hypothetical protein
MILPIIDGLLAFKIAVDVRTGVVASQMTGRICSPGKAATALRDPGVISQLLPGRHARCDRFARGGVLERDHVIMNSSMGKKIKVKLDEWLNYRNRVKGERR